MSEGLRANYLLRQPPSLVLSSPNHAADVDSLLSGPADRGMRRSVTRLPAGPISAAAAASPAAVVLPLVEVGDGALQEVCGAVGVEVGRGVRGQVAVEDLPLAHGAPGRSVGVWRFDRSTILIHVMVGNEEAPSTVWGGDLLHLIHGLEEVAALFDMIRCCF